MVCVTNYFVIVVAVRFTDMFLKTAGKACEENVFFPEGGMNKKERYEDYPPLVLIIH